MTRLLESPSEGLPLRGFHLSEPGCTPAHITRQTVFLRLCRSRLSPDDSVWIWDLTRCSKLKLPVELWSAVVGGVCLNQDVPGLERMYQDSMLGR